MNSALNSSRWGRGAREGGAAAAPGGAGSRVRAAGRKRVEKAWTLVSLYSYTLR